VDDFSQRRWRSGISLTGVSKWLLSAPSEFVADIVCQRLSEGGVRSFSQGAGARRSSLAGAQDIYVEDGDLARARSILKEAETFSEDELAALSEGRCASDVEI
jgi:hypothetical protein